MLSTAQTADLDKRFSYHQPKDDVVKKNHEQVRHALRIAAEALTELIPAGREHALVLTKLEEAMMWANAAIARAQV